MRIKSSIWRLRHDRSMTIDELAKLSGVPRSTVDKWGRDGLPESVSYAVRIADALGVEVRDLMCS